MLSPIWVLLLGFLEAIFLKDVFPGRMKEEEGRRARRM